MVKHLCVHLCVFDHVFKENVVFFKFILLLWPLFSAGCDNSFLPRELMQPAVADIKTLNGHKQSHRLEMNPAVVTLQVALEVNMNNNCKFSFVLQKVNSRNFSVDVAHPLEFLCVIFVLAIPSQISRF